MKWPWLRWNVVTMLSDGTFVSMKYSLSYESRWLCSLDPIRHFLFFGGLCYDTLQSHRARLRMVSALRQNYRLLHHILGFVHISLQPKKSGKGCGTRYIGEPQL